MNIKLEYLYRDAGNNKNWGEVIFTNRNNLSIKELEQEIRNKLIEREFFYAERINIPNLYFPKYDIDLDHDWHEFHSLTETVFEPTDKMRRDISEFLNSIKPS